MATTVEQLEKILNHFKENKEKDFSIYWQFDELLSDIGVSDSVYYMDIQPYLISIGIIDKQLGGNRLSLYGESYSFIEELNKKNETDEIEVLKKDLIKAQHSNIELEKQLKTWELIKNHWWALTILFGIGLALGKIFL